MACRSPWFSLVLMLLLLPLSQANADDEVDVYLNLTTNAPNPVPTGQTFDFFVGYSVASTTQNAQGMRITIPLPSNIQYISSIPTVHVASTTAPASGSNGTVTFIMNSSVPAGSAGTLTIRVRFQEGPTFNGTERKLEAQVSGTNVESRDKDIKVYASASNRWFVDKTGPSTALLDSNVSYPIHIKRNSPGNLNLSSGTLTDTLPVGVLPSHVIDANGGTVTGTGTAGNPVKITWAIPALSAGGSGTSYTRTPVIRYPAGTFTAGMAMTNNVSFTATTINGNNTTTTDSVTTTLTAFTANATASTGKTVNDSTVLATQTFTWSVTASNGGNVPLDNFVITDALPPNFALSTVYLPTSMTNAPAGSFITVKYRRSNTGATTYTWPGGPFPLNTTLTVSSLGLPAGVYISQVEFHCGTIPVGFTTGSGSNRFRLDGRLLINGWDSPSTFLPVGGNARNRSQITANYDGAPAVNTFSTWSTVTLVEPTTVPFASTSMLTTGVLLPGDTLRYRAETHVAWSSDIPMVNPVAMSLLPATVDYVPGSFTHRTGGTFNSAGAPDPTPTLEVLSNYDGTGRTLLRWRYTHSFAPNTTATAEFDVKIKDGTPTGSYTHSFHVGVNPASQAGVVSYNSPVTDSNDLNGNGNRTEQLSRSNTSHFVSRTASLESFKYVKGQMDTQWLRFPDFGRTIPGGQADFRLRVRNSGNVPLKNIVLLDILPFPGDTSVISVGSPRNSEWRPLLAGPLTAPTGVTIYYSTESNPERPEVLTPNPPGSMPANWSTTPPEDITTVRSLKIDFGGSILAPLDEFIIEWPMRVPVNTSTNGEVAWNSCAFSITTADDNMKLPPAEPFKVGIGVQPIIPVAYGDRVWRDLNRNGIQDPGEPGMNGIRVELYRDNGDNIADPATDTYVGFTITTGGGDYLFSSMPQGRYFAVVFCPPSHRLSPVNATDPANDSDGTTVMVRGARAAVMPVKLLDSGAIDLTWDQGFYQDENPTSAVGNYVWFDNSQDGLQNEAPHRGANGVTVRLYNAASPATPVATTVTADDINGNPGYYLFDLVPPGSYFVEFVAPATMSFTTRGPTGTSDPNDSDPNTTTGRTETFTLAPGVYDSSWDAGLLLPSGLPSIGNLVWLDLNNNGYFDPAAGETGINGVTVSLFRDIDGNNVLDPFIDVFYGSTTTFSKGGIPGYYEFTGLPAGDFIVVINGQNFSPGRALAGLVSSYGTAPDPDNDIDHDDNGEPGAWGNVVAKAVTLTPGGEPGPNGASDNGTVDFGFFDPTLLVNLGNLVFVDQNGNGVADEDEGVDGVRLQLFRQGQNPATSTPVATTFTAGGGRYLFRDLVSGSYFVHVPASEFQAGGTLRGTSSLPGVQLGDDDKGEDSIDAPVPAVTGLSTVVVNLQSNAAPTDATTETGIDKESDNDDDDSTDLTVDIGLRRTVAVGNLVFFDANENGVFDPGEGLANVPLQLYSDAQVPGLDAPLATTITAADGSYLFGGLQPGIYRVHVPAAAFLPGAVLQGMSAIAEGFAGDDDVGQNGRDTAYPDIDGISSGLVVLVIGSAPTGDTGETGYLSESDDAIDSAVDLTIDFGFQLPLSLGNLVFIDANRNGHYDADEGIGGVTVHLYQASQDPLYDIPIRSLTTGPDGMYLFSRLNPGSYFLHIPPSQFEYGAPLSGVESIPGTTPNADDDVGEDGVDDLFFLRNGVSTAVINLQRGLQPTNATTETGYFNQLDDHNDANGNLTVDFGFQGRDPLKVGVGNLVYIDSNANGSADPGEGVDGVTVQLFPAGADPQSTTPLATKVTANGGIYLFNDLLEGAYFIHIPATQFQTGGKLNGLFSMPGAGYDWPVDDDMDENGIDSAEPWLTGISSTPFYLAPDTEPENFFGEWGSNFDIDDVDDNNVDLTIDFGFTIPVAVGNLVYRDANGNGRADPGEGVAGVTLRLFHAFANPLFDTPVAETVTDAQGRYLFANLTAGQYFVHIPSWMFAPGGALHGLVNLPGTTSGDDDTGEKGVDDPLYTALGIKSVVFSLAPGTAPAGAAESGFDGASDDAMDTHTDLTVDFGFTFPATFGGTVFHDTNANGLHHPLGADALPGTADDEPGLSSVPVEVWWTGRDGLIGGTDDLLLATVFTGFDGAFSAESLPAGSYYLVIPDSVFAPGAALESLPICTPITVNADNRVNGDNNGSQPGGRATAVRSPVILLSPAEVDTTLGFGFISSLQPTTWLGWQVRNSTLGDTSHTGNSDGDAFTNLLEFAFALNPRGGLATRPPVRLQIDAATQRVDLCYDRVRGIAGVTYTVELLNDLALSPLGWLPATGLAPVVTARPDDTEEVRLTGINSHPLLTGPQGFVRITLSLDADLNGVPESVQRTEVLGWNRVTLGTSLQTLGHTFAPVSQFTGRIDGITGSSINVAASLDGAAPASLLTPGAQHYLEILTGQHAGHRIELDETATSASSSALIHDSVSSRNTLTGQLPATLSGARFALHRHLTLGELAERSLFTSTNSPSTADRVVMYNSATSTTTTYWLFTNGGNPRWVRQGDGTLANQGSLVIEPGRGLFMHPRAKAVNLVIRGQVRAHPFAMPLVLGTTLCAAGWPMNLSPTAHNMLLSAGFTGSNTASKADQIQCWNGDVNPATQTYTGYFLLRAGALLQWVRTGDSTLQNQNLNQLLRAHRSFFIISRAANPSWVVQAPWTP